MKRTRAKEVTSQGEEEGEELIKETIIGYDDGGGISQRDAISPLAHSPACGTDGKSVAKTAQYPYSVLFIVGNEFCERFSFYGMKAILPIYLTAWLGFSENRATTIIHLFNFSAYFFALFGGIISDNLLGKYKTILYLSIVYCIGNSAMAATALPGVTGTPPHWWGILVSLTLIAVGTGGIKPCVASFGGNQFDPSQEKEISVFFSLFYFAINAGSVLSMFLTPLLRKDVHCFGQDSCYSLAFGVPAVLMLVALVVFISGSPLYRKEPARNNVVLFFFTLVATASARRFCRFFKRMLRTSEDPLVPHWLYLASEKYDRAFIEDSRRVLSIFSVFSGVCVFWALFDQQGSLWVYQALMMKSSVNIFGWEVTIIPEQMGLANAVMILVLIPVFSYVIYPLCNTLHIPMRPLTRIFLGMLFAMVSFLMAGLLQVFITSRNEFFSPHPTTDPNTLIYASGNVNILWQLPQYFFITCAELLLSITGLEFAYSQAPASMKSVCQAGWLLTVAGGNLIVIMVTLIDPAAWISSKNPMTWNFFIWSAIMALGSLLFAFLARSYNYHDGRELVEAIGPIETSPTGSTKSRHSFQSDTPLIEK